MNITRAIGVILFSLISLNQAHAKSEETVFHGVAIVENLRSTPNSIMLNHEEIVGLMPAMTMPFKIKNRAILEGISYLDTVNFEFIRHETQFVITKIQRLKAAPEIPKNPSKNPKIGETKIPWDLTLNTHEGNEISLKEYSDKTLVISFIYTRCPTVCPIQTSRLKAIYKKITPTQRDKTQFIAISLDPEHDKAQQLKAFAESHKLINEHWTFLTGEVSAVKRLLNSFNIIASKRRNETEIFNHSSQVFLISKNHPIKIFNGEDPELIKNLFDNIK